MNDSAVTCPRTSADERLRDWRPDIRHPVPGPGESVPPGPKTPAAIQSLKVWSARNTYFPAMRERFGDTFSLRVAPVGKIVVVCHPDDVRAVARGGPAAFPVGENNAMFTPLLGKNNVLSLDGSMHRSERKRMMPAFHGERIAAVVSTLEELTAEEVARWPVGRTFSMVERMRSLTLAVIVRVVMGVDDPERAARLAKALLRVVDVRTFDLFMWIWPRLAKFGPWRKAITGLDHADDLLFEEIRRCREDPNRTQRPDVLSLLLDGEPDEELVRVELVTLLTGGHETTAVASAWMFERLLRHPDVLARVVAGIDDPKDDYRDAVIKEVLRQRPVSYNIGRRVTEPTELGGYRLPAGTFVWASIAAVHNDPRIWGEDVARFRPERWLEPDPPSAYIPYGGGAHRCLGAMFANIEMEVILRTVLRNVELRPDRMAGERPMMRNIIQVPSRGARVRVTRRIGG